MRRNTSKVVGVLAALAILASTTLLGGCSTARNVPVETASATGVSVESADADLVGAYVSLKLRSGEAVSGRVSDVTGGVVTLERPRDGSYDRRTVAVDDVADIRVIEEANAGHPHVTEVGAIASALLLLGPWSPGWVHEDESRFHNRHAGGQLRLRDRAHLRQGRVCPGIGVGKAGGTNLPA